MYVWARNVTTGHVVLVHKNHGKPDDPPESGVGTIVRCKKFVWHAFFGQQDFFGNAETLLEACQAMRRLFIERNNKCAEVPAWASTYQMLLGDKTTKVEVCVRLGDGIVSLTVNGRTSTVDIERDNVVSSKTLAKLLIQRFGDMSDLGVEIQSSRNYDDQIFVWCKDGLAIRDDSDCVRNSITIRMLEYDNKPARMSFTKPAE